jgi:single-strand DNA-binding protein
MDSWDDKQTGQKRSKLKVVGETIQLLGTRQSPANSASNQPPQRQAAAPATKSRLAQEPDFDPEPPEFS